MAEECSAVQSGRIPVEEEIAAGLDHVQRLAWADPGDRGRMGPATGESLRRDVVDLDPIAPLRLGSNEAGVHRGELADERLARPIAQDGDQVDVTDVWLEVTRRERTVDVETHERRPGGVDDGVPNHADDRREGSLQPV